MAHIWRFKRFPRHLGWANSSLSDYELEDGCPISLEAGKSLDVFIPQDTLEEIFEDSEDRKIIAAVQDQLWRTRYSKEFEVPKMETKSET